jgi:hypothetical protein
MAPPKSVSKGAKKAFKAMQKQYGPKLGAKVFYAKAGGAGPKLNKRVSSFYKTRGKQK